MEALEYFYKWAKYWSPAGYWECRCCEASWTEDQPEEHFDDCPVTKFKDEEEIRKLFYDG